jgi:hypothetical protein
MKKILAGLMIAALCIGISFFQKEVLASPKLDKSQPGVLKGKIVSIDNAKNEVTIQDKAGATKTFTAETKQISSLKQGEEITVGLKQDGSTAKSIRVISKKNTKKTK